MRKSFDQSNTVLIIKQFHKSGSRVQMSAPSASPAEAEKPIKASGSGWCLFSPACGDVSGAEGSRADREGVPLWD
jgi:hypothetical protein